MSNVPVEPWVLRDLTLTKLAGPAVGVAATLPEEGPVPSELVAATVHEYAVPLVRLVTVTGEALPVPVTGGFPLDAQVTVYETIALPPLDAGGAKLTVAKPSPEVAVPMVGAPGTVPAIPNVWSTVGAAE